MRKKLADLFLGIILILIGVLYIFKIATNSVFDIFFDGWWSLFIIIPCLYDMIKNKINTGNLIGAGIGVILLLSAQDYFESIDLWKLTVPAILILIGLSIIFRKKNNPSYFYQKENCQNGKVPGYSAIFGGIEPNFNGLLFEGSKVTAVFGGVDLNLRNAIITKDCFIDVVATFGGVDIYLPSNVKVIVNSTPIFGGYDNSFISNTLPDAPIVTINASCIFGGMDIK